MCNSSALKLSVCIATYNRAAFIGATIESILAQMTDECEIVVLDGASTDHTEEVVSAYKKRCDRLRYCRQETNNGIDRDYDRAVEMAAGTYCWLMTDDDILKTGAIAAVSEALDQDLSLIVVNTEANTFNLSRTLRPPFLNFESDRVYGPDEMDRLFTETSATLRYIGGFIIKREIWLERDRRRYFGSMFIHIGVIFQIPLPGKTLVIAKPLIRYRMSNAHTFAPEVFGIFMIGWPSLVWSLGISESAKSKVSSTEPWRDFWTLVQWRAEGYYSSRECQRWIRPRTRSIFEVLMPFFVAMLPGAIVNACFVIYYAMTPHRYRNVWRLHNIKESRYYFRNWQVFKPAP